jgi:hypothetical protein
VTPALGDALESVFERVAQDFGFTREKPLEFHLSRGYAARSYGHAEGRAADIDAVGGKSLLEWKRDWDRATARAGVTTEPQRASAVGGERTRNLGYALYRALLENGGWRVNPAGWHVYRGVMQLFGPWTATEGPWKPMRFENPTLYQRQRSADQQWVYRAHEDHIHVAR